jgi:hypothetical protein
MVHVLKQIGEQIETNQVIGKDNLGRYSQNFYYTESSREHLDAHNTANMDFVVSNSKAQILLTILFINLQPVYVPQVQT